MGKKDESSSSSGSDSEKEDKKKTTKTKQKKPKQVISTSQSFSKRYSYLYNNKKFSDFTVVIGEESIPAHKAILQSNSTFFEKLEGDSFKFPTDDDANAAKSLIKFYYEGIYEYTEESAVVIFTILANKYKTKNFSEFKLPAKVLLNGVIAYVEKDLTNRVAEFDTLCESVNFKKMEKEDLTKLYSKKKWLQKSSSFLNQIILKDMSDDESGSDKDSDKDSDEEEEEEESEEEGGSGKVVELDLKLSHSSFASSYNKKTKVYSMSTGSWYTCISKKPTDKFAVEFGTNCSPVMVGMIPKEKFNQNSSNYNTGHCWYVSSNYLYGQSMTSGNSYYGGNYNQGTVIGMEFFRKKGIMGFYVNGQYQKDAFSNIDKKAKEYAILDVCGSGVSFKFVKPKFKKPKN